MASISNISEIVNELSEYVTDVNAEIARKSITCFSTIAIRLPKMAKTVAGHLRNFISLQITYVTTETLKELKNILRRYPEFIEEFVPFRPGLHSNKNKVLGYTLYAEANNLLAYFV